MLFKTQVNFFSIERDRHRVNKLACVKFVKQDLCAEINTVLNASQAIK